MDKTAEKTKKLELEKEKFLNEVSKTKDKYSKIENEVADVNAKLKITYLKFLLEKKEKKEKQILNKYFKRFKENCQKIKLLRAKKSENEIKNIKKKEKEIEEKLKRRNKLLMDIFYNKDKERTRFLHSCFSQFYYKGLINQFKFRKSIMLDQLKKDYKAQMEEEKRREEEKRLEEERRKKEEEEERKRKEEEESKKREEERKKREE